MGAAGAGNNNQMTNSVFHVENKSCHLFEKCVIQGQQIKSANSQPLLLYTFEYAALGHISTYFAVNSKTAV